MPAHQNRSDLNNPAAKKQQYGEKAATARAVKAVPLAVAPTVAPPVFSKPGERGSFTRPTERPNEAITAGAPFGAGVGPEAAGIVPTAVGGDDVLQNLIALNEAYPNDDLADLIDALKGR